MARYIKANYKVAQYLHVEDVRNKVTDGNYLLWQADILAFGKLIDLPLILGKIGALSLSAKEAKEEQDGTVVRELPVAEDPQFVIATDMETAEDKTEQPVENEGTEDAATIEEEAAPEEPTDDNTETNEKED